MGFHQDLAHALAELRLVQVVQKEIERQRVISDKSMAAGRKMMFDVEYI